MTRVIPLGRRSLTGYLLSRYCDSRLAYESRLERDFLVGLEFDNRIKDVQTQAVTIRYNADGRVSVYTPDVLVVYRDGIDWPFKAQTVLFEVKPRDELSNRKGRLRPKFEAAHAYAKSHGMAFRIVTERHIRTPYLENAEFLLPYLTAAAPRGDLWRFVRRYVRSRPTPTILGELANAATAAGWPRFEVEAGLNYLLALRILRTDFYRQLSADSVISYWLDGVQTESDDDEDRPPKARNQGQRRRTKCPNRCD